MLLLILYLISPAGTMCFSLLWALNFMLEINIALIVFVVITSLVLMKDKNIIAGISFALFLSLVFDSIVIKSIGYNIDITVDSFQLLTNKQMVGLFFLTVITSLKSLYFVQNIE